MNWRRLGKVGWVGLTLVMLVSLFGLVGVYASGSGEEDGGVGLPLPTPAPVQLFFDSFENRSLANWVQDSQNRWAPSGERYRIPGSWSAGVDGPTAVGREAILTLKDAINLSGVSSATLTFSWFIESTLDTGEYLACDASGDNGATWTEIARLRGNVDPENVWRNETFGASLSPYMKATFKLRFRAKMSEGVEDAFVDIVKLVRTSGPVQDVFAVGSSGTIVRYDGSSWNSMTSGTTNRLEDVWGTSGNDVFAVGWNGVIRHWDGAAWGAMSGGATDIDLYGVWGSSHNDVFAVGGPAYRGGGISAASSGIILHYNGNAAGTWSPMDTGIIDDLYDVWGTSPCDVFAVGAAGAILHYDGLAWSPMTSGTGNWLNGVWGTAHNDVFAVGYGGTILHYNGTAWSLMTSGTANELFGVWGSSHSDVFAVGVSGTILHYNGTAWSAMPVTGNLYSVWGSSFNNVFAVGAERFAIHYDGTAWGCSLCGCEVSCPDLYGVWVARPPAPAPTPQPCCCLTIEVNGCGTTDPPPGTYCVACSTVVYISAIPSGNCEFHHWTGDVSEAFSPETSATVDRNKTVTANFVTPSTSEVFAVGWSGTIIRFKNSAWSAMVSGATAKDLHGVWGTTSSDVFAVGGAAYRGVGVSAVGNGVVLHYDGNQQGTWNALTSSSSDLYGVWGTSPNDVFVVGAGYTILHYDGATWSPMAAPGYNPDVDFYGVWGTSHNDVFAVGSQGTVLHYNGTAWSPMASNTVNNLYGVWGTSHSDVFAVGQGGTIIHYDGNVQTSWTWMNSTAELDLYGVWGSSHSDVFAVGAYGTVYHYDGATWTSMGSTASDALHGVWGSSSSDVFAVGSVLHYNGGTWNLMNSGTQSHLQGVWGPSAGPAPTPVPPTPTPAPVPCTQVFYDSFESGIGNWVQDTQNVWSASTRRAVQGVRSAEVRGPATDAALTLKNPLNLSGYSGATLTFSWFIETALGSGEYVACDLWNGASWTKVAELKGNVGPENSWQSQTISLNSYLRSDFKLRFRGRMSATTEHANVDVVKIVACAGPAPTPVPTPTPPPMTILTLEGVNVQSCGQTWTESGVVLSFVPTTAEDCFEGSCYFGLEEPGGVALFPARLNLDLTGLTPRATEAWVDVSDACDAGCTRAFLYAGGSTVDTGVNQDTGQETLHLVNGTGAPVDRLAVSSCEAGVYEIRLGFTPVPPTPTPTGTPPPTPAPTPTPTPSPPVPTPTTPPTSLFFDSFEDGLGNWAVDNQNGWLGSIRRAAWGIRSAEVHGPVTDATLTLKNPLDLTGYATGTLTFDWFIETALGSGEYLACDVWNGMGWTEVARLRGNVDPENAWQRQTVSLNSYLRSDFKVRFRGKMSDNTEHGDVDNVRVAAVP